MHYAISGVMPVHPKANEVGAPSSYRKRWHACARQGKRGGRPCIIP